MILQNKNTLRRLEIESPVIFDTASNMIVFPETYFQNIGESFGYSFGCKYVIYGNIDDLTYRLACLEEDK